MALDEFLATLADHGVRQIADVREAPISRKKGFGKLQLRRALEEAGIAYRHFPDLGTPKPLRDAWKGGSLTAQGFYREYGEHLDSLGPNPLEELLAFAREAPTALLCLEAKAEECHRLIVAQRLESGDGVEVEHL
ncbi:MAG TPA: DUF488 domain-containing protein [bacterium]|nr:DUF488 domain-containing protein [bacterium]